MSLIATAISEEFQVLLDQTGGGSARVWSFTASHDRLVLKFRREGDEVFLLLAGCKRVEIATAWVVATPTVSEAGVGELRFCDGENSVLCRQARLYSEDPTWRRSGVQGLDGTSS